MPVLKTQIYPEFNNKLKYLYLFIHFPNINVRSAHLSTVYKYINLKLKCKEQNELMHYFSPDAHPLLIFITSYITGNSSYVFYRNDPMFLDKQV